MENELESREEEAPGEGENSEEDAVEKFRRLTSYTPGRPPEAPSGAVHPHEPAEAEEAGQSGVSDQNTPVFDLGYPNGGTPMVEVPLYEMEDADIVVGGEEVVEGGNLSDSGPSGPSEDETIPPEDYMPSKHIPPPPLGDTPLPYPPAVDSEGMPLPRRVTETDMGATNVSMTAFTPQERTPPPRSLAPNRPARGGGGWGVSGCLLRMFIWGMFSMILLGLGVVTFMLVQYYSIAATLPEIGDLAGKASQFETTRILDRNGNLLYEILDPNAGRRTYVHLDDISPFMVAATIATEDESYYSHPGFSLFAIVRAYFQNLVSGEVVSGASTITQQVARMLVLDPEEAYQRTYMRKVKEAIVAIEITRRYTKDEILELFLNENFYGNLAYGVEAAAQTYFGTSADKLTLTQASFLAGLPQAPSVYDVYSNPDATFARQQDVLRLMVEASADQGCIYVSNSPLPICVDMENASEAAYALVDYKFQAPDVEIRFPHWVNYIRKLLEEEFDAQTIYRSGFSVETTLDPGLQAAAQEAVQRQVEKLRDTNKVQSGALVAIEPSTGEILAMVGSADFYNEDIDGQINMAISPRQPGSSIKPFTYTAAFEKGWTPATLLWDVKTEFPPSGLANDTREPYVPVNYDEKYHGPVTVRYALANSYNLPAVRTLMFVGVGVPTDTTEEFGLIEMAHRLGITDLNENYYGLSLTLGGGEVKLLDMTAAYAVFANGGKLVPPVAITRITDHEGNVVYEYEPETPKQVIRAEHAFLITSILSDNEARTPAMGANSALKLPFTAAAKTGTTTDFRDNWTLGYTPDIAVGVWVGNPDYTPMQNVSGLSGAAPIWNEFMQIAIQSLTGNNPTPFVKPAGVIEKVICAKSGTEPSQWCSSQRNEFFASDQPPLGPDDDLWVDMVIDTWTRLRASPDCSKFIDAKMALNVTDPWAIKWITETSQGKEWAEEMGFDEPVLFIVDEVCSKDDDPAILEFTNLEDGQTIDQNNMPIIVRAWGGDRFKSFRIHYRAASGSNWVELGEFDQQYKSPEEVMQWDLTGVPTGTVTLRLFMEGKRGSFAETTINLNVQVPTPTATETATITPTETAVPSDTPTQTPIPTNTPAPTNTATNTSPPVATATPTPTS
jgi:penicillin-binding protein 1C